MKLNMFCYVSLYESRLVISDKNCGRDGSGYLFSCFDVCVEIGKKWMRISSTFFFAEFKKIKKYPIPVISSVTAVGGL